MADLQRAPRALSPLSGRAPARVGIAIVGGGPAGCAVALALAQRGVRDVALFDAGGRPGFRIGESLPGAALPLLRRLGVWDAFAQAGHLPGEGSTALWGKDRPGHNDGLFLPFGGGWHLDRAAFDRQMRTAVQAAGVPLFSPLKLRAAAPLPGGGHALRFDGIAGAQSVEAGFLVDATGIGAAALRGLKVARNRLDALAVHFHVVPLATPGEVPPRTFLEAAPEGWWYASPIPGGRMVLALATDLATARAEGLGTAEGLRAALRHTRLIAPLLARGTPEAEGDRAPDLCVAPTAILSAVAGADWLAAGDAAASCDPLLSQGLIRALDEGIAAATAIAEARAGAGDAPLMAYQAAVFRRFTANVRLHAGFYAAESRWPDAPFWRARRPAGLWDAAAVRA